MGDEKKEDFTYREGFEQAGAAIVTAVAAVGAQLPFELTPEQAVMVAVMSPIVGTALGRGVHGLLSGRFPKFADGYTKAFDGDPEEVRQHGEQHKDDSEHHETMYRAFRMMLDAADPAVVPVLGYLAGRYNSAGKRPDSKFRGLGRLLCDLESGEMADLVALLRAAIPVAKEYDRPVISLVIEDADGADSKVSLSILGTARTEIGRAASAVRLFLLLRREGLGDGFPVAKGMRRDVGDHVVRLEWDALTWILSIIDPFPAAQSR